MDYASNAADSLEEDILLAAQHGRLSAVAAEGLGTTTGCASGSWEGLLEEQQVLLEGQQVSRPPQ